MNTIDTMVKNSELSFIKGSFNPGREPSKGALQSLRYLYNDLTDI